MKPKTKKKETVAQKALRLLNKVPAHKFIKGEFTNKRGKCCAIGHYRRLTSKNPSNYSKENCKDEQNPFLCRTGCDLRIASYDFLSTIHNECTNIAKVNNSPTVNGYTQKSIKARVIRLLKDMVKAGY